MDMGLKDRVAIVTGASRGIGRGVAVALIGEGVKVVAVGRDDKLLASLVASAPDRVTAVVCDMTDRDGVSALPRKAVEAYGRLDIVVNNAGVGGGWPLTQLDWPRWDNILEVNVTAPAILSAAAMECFAKQRSGKIINVASTTSIRGVANLAAYSTSKAALAELTRSLALEWAPMGVQVNAIGPGAFETNQQRALLDGPQERIDARLANIPDRRMGKPSEAGYLVCFLASNVSDHITGALYMIDGGESVQLIR